MACSSGPTAREKQAGENELFHIQGRRIRRAFIYLFFVSHSPLFKGADMAGRVLRVCAACDWSASAVHVRGGMRLAAWVPGFIPGNAAPTVVRNGPFLLQGPRECLAGSTTILPGSLRRRDAGPGLFVPNNHGPSTSSAPNRGAWESRNIRARWIFQLTGGLPSALPNKLAQTIVLIVFFVLSVGFLPVPAQPTQVPTRPTQTMAGTPDDDEREALLGSPPSHSISYESFSRPPAPERVSSSTASSFTDARSHASSDTTISSPGSSSWSKTGGWLTNIAARARCWLHSIYRRGRRWRRHVSRALGRLAHAGLIVLVGLGAVAVAYVADMGESHLFDWKFGMCAGGDWKSTKMLCCSDCEEIALMSLFGTSFTDASA